MSGKKFQFSLQSVLRLRSHEAERARQALAEIRREIRSTQETIAAAEEHLTSIIHLRAVGSTGQRSLSLREAFRQEAHEQLENARRDLEELRRREEDARIELLQRLGAEDAIRRLEEQERTRHWKKFEAAEAQQMDEQAVSGFQREKRAAHR